MLCLLDSWMNVWSDYTQSRLNEYIFLRALLVDIWLAFWLLVFAKITHVEEWLFRLVVYFNTNDIAPNCWLAFSDNWQDCWFVSDNLLSSMPGIEWAFSWLNIDNNSVKAALQSVFEGVLQERTSVCSVSKNVFINGCPQALPLVLHPFCLLALFVIQLSLW